MRISELQKLVYEEYKSNGYLDMWTSKNPPPKDYSEEQRIMDLAEVGLFNTEVSEMLEDVRVCGYPLILEKIGEESSDIIIRVLNFASRKGVNVEDYILLKHEKNLKRGERHGKKI